MDLLAIIQGRISGEITTTETCTDSISGLEPAGSDIEATVTLSENASCITGHDANDAPSGTVSTGMRNPPLTAIKDECVMPESNQPPHIIPETQLVGRGWDFSWPQSLVDMFMKLEPPKAPFYLEPHRHIIDPAKFYLSLRHDIDSGLAGPRAKMGVLQHDLKTLILEVQNEQR